jgi:methyl-accepting chemotaxis protein
MIGLASLFRRSTMAAKLTAIDKSFATIEFSLDGHIIAANNNFLATVGYTLGPVENQKGGFPRSRRL